MSWYPSSDRDDSDDRAPVRRSDVRKEPTPMLCLQCGTQNTDLVSYCTKCGANLQAIKSALLGAPLVAPSAQPISGITARFYSTVLVMSALIAIVGIPTVIGGVIAIIAVAKEAGLQPHDLAPLIGFLTVFGIGGVIAAIFLILRSANSRAIVDESRPQQIPPAMQRPQLQAPPRYVSTPLPQQMEPVASVTEHTTSHLPDYVAPPADTPRR